MSGFDLDTPEGRLAAAEALGPERYNEAMRAHHEASVLERVNGYALRRVVSQRFGVLIMVDPTGTGFNTIESARDHANSLPERKDQ